MDKQLEQEMLTYYDERAGEFDQVYAGKEPAIQRYSDQYVSDVDTITRRVAAFGHGHMIDVACGTGFWAPHYARNCSQITFLDQSECMLSECRSRVDKLRLVSVAHFIQGNFFEAALEPSTYDCAMVGFLLSHFTSQQECVFFEKLKEILVPSAGLMIIDSLWNERRKKSHRKEGVQERTLNDGRVFKIYKRYFDEPNLKEMMARHRFALKSLYVGDMFIAATAERQMTQ